MTDAADIADDAPLTLKEACELHFRNRVKVGSLKAEADRGRLDIFRVGRTYFTTVKDLRKMEKLCREERQARVSISTLSANNGSSETEQISSARAALSEMVQRLKSSSPNISAASTRRNLARTR